MWRDFSSLWALVAFAVLIVLIFSVWLFLPGADALDEDALSDLKDEGEPNKTLLDQQTQIKTKISDHKIRAFQLAKIGDSLFECEDAFAISDNKNRLAISDGVSQSFASRIWAQTIVKHLVKSEIPSDIEILILEAAKEWQFEVESQLNPNTQWNVRKKIEVGAQATFASLIFEIQGNSLQWAAQLIGDCAVAQISVQSDLSHGVTLCPSSYLDSPNGNPDTVSSQPPYVRGTPISYQGVMHAGDRLLVMTDALAIYMAQMANEGACISSIFPFLSEDTQNPYVAFEHWANSLRPSEIEDDDLTLIEIGYG
jgi:hypothetical protein